MANHLIAETSPYLLQHSHNPVDWYPWGAAALQKARDENKLIFLSIGYAACHWCHVMAHESFENPATAAILNNDFISIKVDREERPDIDMIYMIAVQNLTGQGGWPLNVFLTPGCQPFYGGTYFPPIPRYGMPAFNSLLDSLVKLWREEPSKILEAAGQLSVQVASEAYWAGKSLNSAELEKNHLQTAVHKLNEGYDWDEGGWGSAPKFPAPMSIDFLLSQSIRGNPDAAKVAVHALKAMQRGGMYDVVGGGFHRYSTDEAWLVPHFEKMLYDNAQLAQAYLHAYQVTGDLSFRKTAEETLDFILREMTGVEGGFYSSLDADSDGEEGKFYVWTLEELRLALGDQVDFEFLSEFFKIPRAGNFEGKIILQKKAVQGSIALPSGLSQDQFDSHFSQIRHKLLDYRSKRQRPAADTKVLVSWNALAIQAFTLGGTLLGRPDFHAAAHKAADFLLSYLLKDGELFRSWRNGTTRHFAILEDYGNLISALLALYQVDFDPHRYLSAVSLTKKMIELFRDSVGGFFLTHEDQTDLSIRPKDLQDNVTPSGNSAAVYSLLLMASFSGDGAWYSLAEEVLTQVQETLARYPHSFPYWLKSLDFAIGPVNQVAVISPEGVELLTNLGTQFHQRYHPRSIIAAASFPPLPGSPEILLDRPAMSENSTVYICHSFVCDQPLTNQEQIMAAFQALQ